MIGNKKAAAKLEEAWGKPKESIFRFGMIETFYAYKRENNNSYFIDDQVAEDIDFEDFFETIDRTSSTVGQQYLYFQLRSLNQNSDYLPRLEKDVEYYGEIKSRRLNIQKELQRLSKPIDYNFPFLIFGKIAPVFNTFFYIRLLQIFTLALVFICFLFPNIFIALIPVVCLNLYLHYYHKKQIGNFVSIFGRLNALVKVSQKLLAECNLPPTEKQSIQHEIRILKKLISKIQFLHTEHLSDNEFTMLLWNLIELLKIISLADIISYHNIITEIKDKRGHIESLFKFVGNIDLSISIASLRAHLPYYSTPSFTSVQKEIYVKGIYHPLVEACIANDFHLKNKSLLLTGSNMSGKSTFVKALNLNVISSQVLNTSFSRQYEAPFFKIATSINISDNITENKSYFLDEVISVGELIELSEESESQFLFTLDELFRGTNTIERVSLAKAILAYLNRKQHIVLVSTHDIELTQLLQQTYELNYFQESIDNDGLSFDYKLRKGALQKRNAIKIVKHYAFPEELVEEAQDLALKLEQEKLGYEGDV